MIYFVTPDDFKTYGGVVGNYDFEYLTPYIIQAQVLDIAELIGQRLIIRLGDGVNLDNLNSQERHLMDFYIKPAVVNFALYRGMDFLNFKVQNAGIGRRDTESQQSATMDETSYLGDRTKTVAESYGKRLVDYLNANIDLFLEYKTEIEGEVRPSDTPSFSGGMWLGKGACDTAGSLRPIAPARPYIDDFRLLGHTRYREIGLPITSPVFQWQVLNGTPNQLTITDDAGVLTDQPVFGTQYNSTLSYNGLVGDITNIVLNGDNVSPNDVVIEWVNPTYYGVNFTGDYPTSIEIAQGAKLLLPKYDAITVDLNTTDAQFGWIAVPIDQTGLIFTHWEIDDIINTGVINAPNGFIKRNNVTVTANGYEYLVYIWAYASKVEQPITLNIK